MYEVLIIWIIGGTFTFGLVNDEDEDKGFLVNSFKIGVNLIFWPYVLGAFTSLVILIYVRSNSP